MRTQPLECGSDESWCVCVCGQVDASASLILLLLDGLRKVLITEAPEGFACSKLSKLNLEGEDEVLDV